MSENKQINKSKNGFLITCISCIVILLVICYFGINNSIKGTRAATTVCVACPSGWTAASTTSMYCSKSFTYYNDSAKQSCVEGSGSCTTTTISTTDSPKYQHVCSCTKTRTCTTAPDNEQEQEQETITCSAGKYFNGSGCTTCPAGSYCPGGTFKKSNGSQGKNACPAGTTSPSGSTTSKACKAETSSQKCPTAGKYYDGSNCVSCTAGYYCPASSDDKITCPAGSYCPSGVGSPISCPANHYCLSGSASATSCPSEKPISPSGSTSSSACKSNNPSSSSTPGTSSNPSGSGSGGASSNPVPSSCHVGENCYAAGECRTWSWDGNNCTCSGYYANPDASSNKCIGENGSCYECNSPSSPYSTIRIWASGTPSHANCASGFHVNSAYTASNCNYESKTSSSSSSSSKPSSGGSCYECNSPSYPYTIIRIWASSTPSHANCASGFHVNSAYTASNCNYESKTSSSSSSSSPSSSSKPSSGGTGGTGGNGGTGGASSNKPSSSSTPGTSSNPSSSGSGGNGGTGGASSNNPSSSSTPGTSSNSSGSGSGGNGGSGGTTSSNNNDVTNNPQTGSISIFIVWVVALGAIVYSAWYFRNIRES